MTVPSNIDRDPRAGWSKALVYGLGLSGHAAARLLRVEGTEVVGVDGRAAEDFADRALAPLRADRGVELHLGAEPDAAAAEALLDGVEAVVTSPGVPPERPLLAAARRRGVPVLAEVELAFRHLEKAEGDDGSGRDSGRDTTVVAITGSNGKSTTTAMTGSLLQAAGRAVAVCGNIGTPFAEAVTSEGADTFVVELSSFQLEAVDRFRPQAAALLNISPDHIDRHGDLETYAAAKARIFRNQGAGDLAVLNADDPRTAALATSMADRPGRRRLFSRRAAVADGCYLAGDRVLEVAPGAGASELFALEDLTVDGSHNVENAMAAALLARGLAAPRAAIKRGLRAFRGLPHRLERIAERRGVRWYDDSKGTNVGATCASLEGFADGSVHLILGGRGKGADFASLVAAVAAKARRVYLIGESAPAIAAALDAGSVRDGRPVPYERVETLARAVAAADRAARPGEVVLLSPACASFDQFASFVDRGRTFSRLVDALESEEAGHGA